MQTAVQDGVWRHFGSPWHKGPVFVRGEGAVLTDNTGHRVIDALAGLMCVNVGYGRRSIGEAMAAQAERLSYGSLFGVANEPALVLAQELLALAPPGFGAVYFTTGGSTAIETALKIAYQYHRLRGETDRELFASRLYSYHGSSLGAASVSGMSLIRDSFQPRPPILKLFAPCYPYRCSACSAERSCDLSCLGSLEARLGAAHARRIAAVLVEPVQNGGGAFASPEGYMQRVRELCDEHGALMISDETVCSFGRLGTWYGAQRYEYVPDMIIVGKGLSSGYAPMGALLVHERVLEVFRSTPGFSLANGFTYGGHPIACAAAAENIRILREERLPERVLEELEPLMKGHLRELAGHEMVGDVRGAGAFWAVELVADKEQRTSLRGERTVGLLERFSQRLYARGVFCRADDRAEPTITLAPPLTITPGQIEMVFRAITVTLDEMRREVHG